MRVTPSCLLAVVAFARSSPRSSEPALQNWRVNPAAELEADRKQRTHELEAQAPVQRDRTGVGAVADDRKHLAPRSALASRDQFAEQRRAYAEAALPFG